MGDSGDTGGSQTGTYASDQDGDYEYSYEEISDETGHRYNNGEESNPSFTWGYEAVTIQDEPQTIVDEGDNDGSTETTDGDGWYITISGGIALYPTLSVEGVGGSPPAAHSLLLSLEEQDSARIPGGPGGIDWSELPSLSIDYEPDTSGMKGDALPDAEAPQLHNVEGTGTYDGVSGGAPPAAALTLIALAAAGHDPADITIPTIGSKAASDGDGSSSSSSSTSSSTSSGGFGSDAVRVGGSGGASASGVMVSLGVVSVGTGADSSSASGAASIGGRTSTGAASTGGATSTSVSTSEAGVMKPDGEPVVRADGSNLNTYWEGAKGFVFAIPKTFMTGAMHDSVDGMQAGAFDSIVGKPLTAMTGGYIEFRSSMEPRFGNQEAFQNGRAVGTGAGFVVNMVLAVSGIRGVVTGIRAIQGAGGLSKGRAGVAGKRPDGQHGRRAGRHGRGRDRRNSGFAGSVGTGGGQPWLELEYDDGEQAGERRGCSKDIPHQRHGRKSPVCCRAGRV